MRDNSLQLLLLLQSFFFLPQLLIGQHLNKADFWHIKPIVGIQFWSSYSQGTKRFDPDLQTYLPVEDRYNLEIRRTRVGFTAQPHTRLRMKWVIAADNVGRDLLSGQTGGANNGSFPKLGLWQASLEWRILAEKELAFLSFGYMVPHLGRESYTSALNVSSLEKSWTQNYIRRHLSGTGPGRSLGINLGGFIQARGIPIALTYNLGLFSPTYTAYQGNSAGNRASPLWVAHAIFQIGDPESPGYKMGHKINYYGQRKGLSLGVGAARQAATDLFEANYTASVDFLFNWGPLNLDGDWSWLSRIGKWEENGTLMDFQTNARTFHIRASYNIGLPREQYLEPVLLFTQFQGAMDTLHQQYAARVGESSGLDRLIDAGLNYHLHKGLKLGLHYTWRTGDLGESLAGNSLNNYYFQSGVGSIKRGNWIGLALQLKL